MKKLLPLIIGLILGGVLVGLFSPSKSTPELPSTIYKEITKIKVIRDTLKIKTVEYKTRRETIKNESQEVLSKISDLSYSESIDLLSKEILEYDSGAIDTLDKIKALGKISTERKFYKKYSDLSDSIISSQDSLIKLDSLEISKKDTIINIKESEVKDLEKKLKKQKILTKGIGILGLITTILGLSL